MPNPFPTTTQYASPDLIAAIAYAGHNPGNDPRWHESGAPDQDDYTRWCGHLCGIACLHMALTHRDGHAPTLFELRDGALRYGAYTEQDGKIRGLIYAPAVTYAQEVHGLDAQAHPNLPMNRLLELLDTGHQVIASVHKEIRRPERPAPGQGGHLVLVTGHSDGTVAFRNPSGHTEAARDARLPATTFAMFYAGRGIGIAASTPHAG
ncbi:C39 family peptidase [Streptomyces sp. NPDC059835]|uniref:C39 family peptidase n=1 Tax=Streptomyces sp. NPDC059835 TaxID=3346967 RepID=UPI00364AE4A3